MQYRITIAGDSPLITHDVIAGMDETSEANREKATITARKGRNRTEADNARLRELECLTSIWLTERNDIGIPTRAIRAAIEAAARQFKQGAQVRQGLQVLRSDFEYDRERYGHTLEDLARTTQFTVPVRVQRSTINRTRAKFDLPWRCTFIVNVDEELIDETQLTQWLDIAGRRIGIGDWRPATSGSYGQFTVERVESLEQGRVATGQVG